MGNQQSTREPRPNLSTLGAASSIRASRSKPRAPKDSRILASANNIFTEHHGRKHSLLLRRRQKSIRVLKLEFCPPLRLFFFLFSYRQHFSSSMLRPVRRFFFIAQDVWRISISFKSAISWAVIWAHSKMCHLLDLEVCVSSAEEEWTESSCW